MVSEHSSPVSGLSGPAASVGLHEVLKTFLEGFLFLLNQEGALVSHVGGGRVLNNPGMSQGLKRRDPGSVVLLNQGVDEVLAEERNLLPFGRVEVVVVEVGLEVFLVVEGEVAAQQLENKRPQQGTGESR